MGLNRKKEFNENSYVKVNDRLAEFRQKYPTGLLSTVRSEDARGGLVFKAVLCRDHAEAALYGTTGLATATGHSYTSSELRDGDKVEEFAETVAVGRALAILGLSVEKSIATQEEMDRYNANKQSLKTVKKQLKKRPKKRLKKKYLRKKLQSLKLPEDLVVDPVSRT